MFKVDLVHDSIWEGYPRLSTFVLTYPRIIHSELMTHRVFSRNAASSRAIPVEKLIGSANFVPLFWGKNQKGMVAGSESADCTDIWLEAMESAKAFARKMAERGLHKQICNRLLETFSWITVVVTATEWENFFNLRVSGEAEPHFNLLASMIREIYLDSVPVERSIHLPLGGNLRESVSNCAAVSYLKHQASPNLFDKLWESKHLSPFEHQARVGDHLGGNLRGWRQLRKEMERGICVIDNWIP